MSDLDPKNTVVALARLNHAKLGAIYFDYVVPIFIDNVPRELFPLGFGEWEPASPSTILKKVQKSGGGKKVTFSFPDGRRMSLADDKGTLDLNALELANEFTFLHLPYLQEKLHKQMRKAQIGNAPIIASGEALTANESARNLSDVTITMANMPLVSVEGASWEQIIELRQDAEALRRLRLYIAKEYIGKPKDQIEAGIMLDLENYKTSARKHGFSLLAGTLQATADAKMLLGSVGGGAFLGSLIGPEYLTMGAVAGISLEIAKISISAAKGLYDVGQVKRNHPLAYVFRAQSIPREINAR